MRYSPLITDLYELTVLAGYCKGMAAKQAAFDLYFRTNPFEGGYAVFAGLEPALDALAELRFAEDELAYLAGLGLFDADFIAFLRLPLSRHRGGTAQGTVVFASRPLCTVTGTLAETQLVETLLLNIINFQTLVATKAARVCTTRPPA